MTGALSSGPLWLEGENCELTPGGCPVHRRGCTHTHMPVDKNIIKLPFSSEIQSIMKTLELGAVVHAAIKPEDQSKVPPG